jgi:hypothetical protein
MANEEHVALLKQGVHAWNAWREANPDPPGIRIDLAGANLAGANLTKANLRKVSLVEADLTETDLTGADLRKADLRKADLRKANLTWANLWGAELMEANLTRADLTSANFMGTDLTGADLTRANLNQADLTSAYLTHARLNEAAVAWTVFGRVDLSEATGLDSVKHGAPSSIGIDTIYLSGGNIPEIFLRGCGVPDTFIEYIRSLVGQAIQFYSCFISHSSKDEAFAKRLHADLQDEGVSCWFAPEDLRIGDRFRRRIEDEIRVHDKLLLVLSEHSVDSDWVETEVETALEKERQHKRDVLFPIRLDDAVKETSQAWARHIRRTRHIGDFRGWKDHDCYQGALTRLLRDLKAEDATADA